MRVAFFVWNLVEINWFGAEITPTRFEINLRPSEITLFANEITLPSRVLSFFAFCEAKSNGFGQLDFRGLGELLANDWEFPYYGDELLSKFDEFPSNSCEFFPTCSAKIKTPPHYAKTFHHFGFGMSCGSKTIKLRLSRMRSLFSSIKSTIS